VHIKVKIITISGKLGGLHVKPVIMRHQYKDLL